MLKYIWADFYDKRDDCHIVSFSFLSGNITAVSSYGVYKYNDLLSGVKLSIRLSFVIIAQKNASKMTFFTLDNLLNWKWNSTWALFANPYILCGENAFSNRLLGVFGIVVAKNTWR